MEYKTIPMGRPFPQSRVEPAPATAADPTEKE